MLAFSAEDDARLSILREAVEFWNGVFAEIGSPFRLGPVTQQVGSIPADELQALSARLLGRGGGGDMPDSVRMAPGDLIVALSDGDFVSFAMRWPAAAKAIVAIRSHRQRPLVLPNVARNVIAHELGHAIGLGHNADPTMLMCGRPAPCRPEAFMSQSERFFPLTAEEKAALLRMYPPGWPGG